MRAPETSVALRRLKRWLVGAGRMAALALVLLWSAFPIALVVLASLRMPNDIFSGKG